MSEIVSEEPQGSISNNPFKKLSSLFSKFSNLDFKKKTGILVLTLAVIAIPTTVFFVSNLSNNFTGKQHAAEMDAAPADIINANTLETGKINDEDNIPQPHIIKQTIVHSQIRRNTISNETTSSTPVNQCGTINSSGTYYLTSNLADNSGQDYCLYLGDPKTTINNITLDCQGYSITSPVPFGIQNVNGFQVKNCNINTTNDGMEVLNSNNGVFQNNLFNMPVAKNYAYTFSNYVLQSNNLMFENNTFVNMLWLNKSFGAIIQNNKFKSTFGTGQGGWAALINLTGGKNNSAINNEIDGNSDGTFYQNEDDDFGTDDGINVRYESGDKLIGNTIINTFDTGIETIGKVTNLDVENNKIYNAGFGGIGGWYNNQIIGSTFKNNKVSSTPNLFIFFVISDAKFGTTYNNYNFTNNTFENNTMSDVNKFTDKKYRLNNEPENFSSLFDLRYSVKVKEKTSAIDDNITVANNTFKNNDFTVAFKGPYLRPVDSSMFLDGGGNVCKSFPWNSLINCNSKLSNPTDTPTPTPTPVITNSPTNKPNATPTSTSSSVPVKEYVGQGKDCMPSQGIKCQSSFICISTESTFKQCDASDSSCKGICAVFQQTPGSTCNGVDIRCDTGMLCQNDTSGKQICVQYQQLGQACNGNTIKCSVGSCTNNVCK